MTAVGTVPVDRFEHEAMFYRDDDDFLAGLVPFVIEGLDRDESVLVALPRARLHLLRGSRQHGGPLLAPRLHHAQPVKPPAPCP